MRRYLVSLIAILAVVALVAPSFAVEFKYGGMYRWRIQAKENMLDANSDKDDTANWIDQRIRMFFDFIGSENLKLVTKWEADTMWGFERTYSGMAGRHGSGDVGADAVNLEMKNVYIDFVIPNTPVRTQIGVQGFSLLSGWIFEDDASAALFNFPLDPVKVRLGYIAALNQDVINDFNDMDDFFIELSYAEGPLKLAGVLFYQYGHDTDFGYPNYITYAGNQSISGTPLVNKKDNQLVDLGFSLNYKLDWLAAYLNFVKNFGGYDIADSRNNKIGDEDYKGWLIEGNISYFMKPFTLNLGGFVASDKFAYPVGRSHYWSEIAGIGTLDDNVGGARQPYWNEGSSYAMGGGVSNRGDYDMGDAPRNLWTIWVGGTWQALDTTKVTLNYYYLGTYKKVIADEKGTKDDSIGHELNLYIDQQIAKGFELRLVGAYLIADDALSKSSTDDNIYEIGAQLLWKF
ncbi:MAG: hypothetical protein N2260_06170 [Syntrophobacterales bacterium]|nr:hypothetical protein [Syntrophobacterales bacterium]